MVNFQSTPGLMEQDAKQVVSHFSSMSSNKLKLGAISSPVISAGLVLFYQPPSGASAKCAFSWNRSILEIVWICSDRLKKKKGRDRGMKQRRRPGFILGGVGWNTPHFSGLIAVKVAANNRERWFSALTLCQQRPLCSLISEVMDGHLKTLSSVIHFIRLLPLVPAWPEVL